MFNVLIDTSVWLDLAADAKQTPLLDLLENLLSDGRIALLVPRIVVDEFNKNRGRIAKSSAKSLSTHFDQVKSAIRKADGDKRQKGRVLDYLSDLDHRIPILGGAAESVLAQIAAILSASTIIEASDAVKLRAADRALHRKAPCHHENKNSMADAVLIETYFECVRTMGGAGQRFAFVTHNKHDFSRVSGDQRLPHADFAASFSKIKSMYFVTLADCLRRIDPMRVTYAMWEQEWEQEPRSLTEILQAMDRLTTQVWYNRHKYLAWQIERGKHKIVSREEWDRRKLNGQTHTIDEIWKGALRSAKRAERKLGEGNYGPWSDFEWGMINGKLSALRWALGEDWDELYT
ncbi:PIN domain-containing protein [Paraburkholderia fungorum]|uniref:PIN domain-containing protein n=1 Tax=Paraburkholderia fungorum TaxID=134537 RepID=A0AAP5Q631_9BURK|nr:PIN domain-containing protein [Paraburkholderia fungorum]MDT8837803.1 PIN domain-containing protein [Paraburkholderia fungorum]